MASPPRDSTPRGADTGHQTPPRSAPARPVEHTPTPSPRASRTLPRKEASPKTLEVRDADGRLVKRPVVLDNGAIEEVRAANASKDIQGFERAALKVWGDDLPPFILDGAYILFLMAEPTRLAEFEDDDLEAIVNLMLHWCGKMGRPELKANITVAKLREAAVECSE